MIEHNELNIYEDRKSEVFISMAWALHRKCLLDGKYVPIAL